MLSFLPSLFGLSLRSFSNFNSHPSVNPLPVEEDENLIQFSRAKLVRVKHSGKYYLGVPTDISDSETENNSINGKITVTIFKENPKYHSQAIDSLESQLYPTQITTPIQSCSNSSIWNFICDNDYFLGMNNPSSSDIIELLKQSYSLLLAENPGEIQSNIHSYTLSQAFFYHSFHFHAPDTPYLTPAGEILAKKLFVDSHDMFPSWIHSQYGHIDHKTNQILKHLRSQATNNHISLMDFVQTVCTPPITFFQIITVFEYLCNANMLFAPHSDFEFVSKPAPYMRDKQIEQMIKIVRKHHDSSNFTVGEWYPHHKPIIQLMRKTLNHSNNYNTNQNLYGFSNLEETSFTSPNQIQEKQPHQPTITNNLIDLQPLSTIIQSRYSEQKRPVTKLRQKKKKKKKYFGTTTLPWFPQNSSYHSRQTAIRLLQMWCEETHRVSLKSVQKDELIPLFFTQLREFLSEIILD